MQAFSNPRLWRASTTLAALAACGAATAATLEYDFTVPTTSTTFSASPSVNRFDPSLGTLMSVTFGLRDTMTSTISLSNQSSSSAQSLKGTVNGTFSLKNSGGTTTYLNDALMVQNGTGVDGYGTFAINPNNTPNYNSPYGHVFDPKTVTGSYVMATAFDATTLNGFKGTTPISFLYNATAIGTTTSDNNNYLAAYQTTAAANGYVIYTYAPVPEPASFAALAVGAVAFVRRRKAGMR